MPGIWYIHTFTSQNVRLKCNSTPQLLLHHKKCSQTYLIFGGRESIRAVIRSVLFIDNVVVVLYDPELLSWYSCSVTTAVGTSFLIISIFLLAEFLALVGLTCTQKFNGALILKISFRPEITSYALPWV